MKHGADGKFYIPLAQLRPSNPTAKRGLRVLPPLLQRFRWPLRLRANRQLLEPAFFRIVSQLFREDECACAIGRRNHTFLAPSADAILLQSAANKFRDEDLRSLRFCLDNCSVTRYTIVVIRSFRHAGLEKFFKTGSKAGIQPAHARKLENQLLALNEADRPSQMNLPGWHLHPLQGELTGHWSVRVNGNWRMIFRFQDGDAVLVDYRDYH